MRRHHVFHRCWPRRHRLDPALTISNFCFLLLGGFSRLPTRLPKAAKGANTAKSQGTHAWVFCCSCRPRLPRRIRSEMNGNEMEKKLFISIHKIRMLQGWRAPSGTICAHDSAAELGLGPKDTSVLRASCLPSHPTLSEN